MPTSFSPACWAALTGLSRNAASIARPMAASIGSAFCLSMRNGCSGLAMDPQNPHTLFAGMWQVEMHTYGEFSGGPGSGVYVSHDGGTKWTRIEEHGMPKSPVGQDRRRRCADRFQSRVRVDSNADQGSLWRSDDGGEELEGGQLSARADRPRRILHSDCGFAGERERSSTSPTALSIGRWTGVRTSERFRGAETTTTSGFDPTNPDRFVITDDGGMNITTVHGRGLHRVKLPIGQMYHVAVDNQVPYYLYSNMQDDGNMRGPSVPIGSEDETGWDHGMGGCESGFTMPDHNRSKHRLGDLLRQRSDSMGCANQAGAFGQPLAAHAGLTAQ